MEEPTQSGRRPETDLELYCRELFPSRKGDEIKSFFGLPMVIAGLVVVGFGTLILPVIEVRTNPTGPYRFGPLISIVGILIAASGTWTVVSAMFARRLPLKCPFCGQTAMIRKRAWFRCPACAGVTLLGKEAVARELVEIAECSYCGRQVGVRVGLRGFTCDDCNVRNGLEENGRPTRQGAGTRTCACGALTPPEALFCIHCGAETEEQFVEAVLERQHWLNDPERQVRLSASGNLHYARGLLTEVTKLVPQRGLPGEDVQQSLRSFDSLCQIVKSAEEVAAYAADVGVLDEVMLSTSSACAGVLGKMADGIERHGSIHFNDGQLETLNRKFAVLKTASDRLYWILQWRGHAPARPRWRGLTIHSSLGFHHQVPPNVLREEASYLAGDGASGPPR